MYFTSCEKSDSNNPKHEINPNNSTSALCFLNDKAIPENDVRLQDTNLYHIEVMNSNEATNLKNESAPISSNYYYSSEEKYIEFGEKYGYDFEKHLYFEKVMKAYAQNSGAIAEFEKTGIIPQWYLDYEQEMYSSIVENSKERLKASFTIRLNDQENWSGGGDLGTDYILMSVSFPTMPPGWDDRVSSIEFIGLGGGVHIYNSKFYLKKLKTILNPGMFTINLGDASNKMSSGFRFL